MIKIGIENCGIENCDNAFERFGYGSGPTLYSANYNKKTGNVILTAVKVEGLQLKSKLK